ncbi:MAG: tetratricopeptide repeat protein [Okeania sp. SIO2D1]|nr:tetratricopeptide repeat protein [Okeania sp. SIO2D1]
MKHITKLIIGLITIALVGYSKSEAEISTVEIVTPSSSTGDDRLTPGNSEAIISQKDSSAQDAESYFEKAVKHYNEGKYEEAIADFNQAIRLNPKYAKAYNGRGLVYTLLEKNEKALADYNQAIRLNPKYAQAYNNRGIVYRRQGKNEKALADYNQAIQLNPKYARAYNNRGLVYRKQGENEKALADFNQAIRFNPKYARAYHNRGLIHKGNKNIEKARSDLKKAADLHKQQGNQKFYQDSLDQLRKLQ